MACAKFAESQQLDPAPGTLLNLGDCEERRGRLVDAAAAFAAAVEAARREGRRDWAAIGAARAERIAPRLSYVDVQFDATEASALTIVLDGASLPRAAFHDAMAVDPSPHVLSVRDARGHAWETTFRTAEGQRVSVTVPRFESDDSPPAAAPPRAPVAARLPERPGPPLRTAAIAAFGVSAFAAGLGAYFVVDAVRTNDEAARRCPTSPRCTDREAVTLTDDAKRSAAIATGSFITAIAAAGAGTAFLMLASPSRRVDVSFGPSAVDVRFTQRF